MSVSLAHDPRHPFYRLTTVEHYGNVVGGVRRRIEFINVPMDVRKQYAVAMLDTDRPCWFACSVRWHYYPKFGSLDCGQFDYGLLGLDSSNPIKMSKRERMDYGALMMDDAHSMVLVGYDRAADSGDIVRWKVENSWGDKRGNKGYMMMTDEWFEQFVVQVVVQKDMLSRKIVSVLDTKPIVLPRWDPFGQ